MGVWMSNYLRNQFPCLGMQRPVRNEAQKEILSSWNGAYPELHQLVEELWKEPHREYVLFSSLFFSSLLFSSLLSSELILHKISIFCT